MDALASIDDKDREIGLQFSFSNFEAIPQFLDDLPEETMVDATVRQQLNEKGSGVDLTGGGQFRGKMLDLRGLPAGLLHTNYQLVGVWKQE